MTTFANRARRKARNGAVYGVAAVVFVILMTVAFVRWVLS